tara:strand:- start:2930 stop:4351 length:1422 start_codon:yes stop_codon:yes gene_type:complete
MNKNKVKNICCIGAGYVGGPTMAVFAKYCKNLKIVVSDINKERIDSWNEADTNLLPIYEPDLDKIIINCRNKNLFFTTNIEESIADADMIFLSVNTPTKLKGVGAGKASDLRWVEASARQIAKYSTGHTIVVEKSTLPVRTAKTIKKILFNTQYNHQSDKKTFSVLSNPEFLSEGNAINDLENPDRVLIGGDDKKAIDLLEDLYLNWVPKEKILKTNIWSSELSKLTANAFLAQRISSINAISALCEVTEADIKQVSKAIGMDTRIGNKFLSPGPGFGGSCFQKDILNLVYLCEYYNLNEVANYWQQVVNINNWQKDRISKLIVNKLFGTVSQKKLTVLGFAFKANTNDTRNSPCIKICKDLLEEGAIISIYDPKVNILQIEEDLCTPQLKSLNEYSQGGWVYSEMLDNAVKDSHAIIILTEWEEFKEMDFEFLFSKMYRPSWIFDTRSILDAEKAEKAGFNVWQVGNYSKDP